MRKILLCASMLVASVAVAQPKTAELASLGLNPELAAKLGEEAVCRSNNTYVKMKNAAGTANIDVLKVDASDETVLNADTGDSVKVQVAETTELEVSGSTVTIASNALTVTAGELTLGTSGKTLAIQEATAAATCMGSITANGTTAVTTSTTCATTGSRILITRTAAPSGTAQCWVTNIVNGTSFDLDCDGAETGTFNYFILHEAA